MEAISNPQISKKFKLIYFRATIKVSIMTLKQQLFNLSLITKCSWYLNRIYSLYLLKYRLCHVKYICPTPNKYSGSTPGYT